MSLAEGRQTPKAPPLPFVESMLPGALAGRTVAPRKALSRWLCCLASCSNVSSRRMRWSRSYCRDFCHFLLCVWASTRKSRQACSEHRDDSQHPNQVERHRGISSGAAFEASVIFRVSSASCGPRGTAGKHDRSTIIPPRSKEHVVPILPSGKTPLCTLRWAQIHRQWEYFTAQKAKGCKYKQTYFCKSP